MRRSVFSIVLWLFVTLFLVQASFAQDSLSIAFVNSGRTEILSYTAARKNPVVILKEATFGPKSVKFRFLSALAATKDAKTLLIGGRIIYSHPILDGVTDSIQGFFRCDLDSNFQCKVTGPASADLSDQDNKAKYTFGTKIKVLALTPNDENILKPLPLGVLSDDGTEWFGTFSKTGAEKFTFYHGKMDNSAAVDVGTLNDISGSGYHMTNLIFTVDPSFGPKLVLVLMEGLASQTAHNQRCRVIRWTPKNTGTQFSFNDVNGAIPTVNGSKNSNIDSSFTCILRKKSSTQAEIGFCPNDPGNIKFYDFPYQNGAVSFSENGRAMPRNIIPDSIAFFAGLDGPSVQGELDDREVSSDMQRYVNGGDAMFTPSGDTIIFIVHDNTDKTVTIKKTGIWMYDIAAGGKAKFLYNDVNAKERQPIFLGYRKNWSGPPPPPVPGSIKIEPVGFVEFPDSVEINKTATISTIKITETTGRKIYLKSILITGPNESSYAIVGVNPLFTIPDTLQGNASITLTIQFAPTTVGHHHATLTVTYGIDSTKKIDIMGNAKAKQSGVAGEEDASFNVHISPNPFTSKTHVSVSGDENATFNISLRDVLGRDMQLKALPYNYLRGGAADYEIDAQSLGLTPGAYYLQITSGGKMVTRQIVYVR